MRTSGSPFLLIGIALLLSFFGPLSNCWAAEPGTPGVVQEKTPEETLSIKAVSKKVVDGDKESVQKILSDKRTQNALESLRKKDQQIFSSNGGWGGGNSIRRNGTDQPVLLDFFTENPNFVEASPANSAPLVDTDYMKYVGWQSIEVKQIPAYARARQILEAWRASNQGLIDILIVSLDNLSVNYVWQNVPLARAETYYLPAELRRQFPLGRLTPTVVYHKDMGLLISAIQWNQLGDLSQAGMLIHEALRRLQLTYQLTVSPQKLQALTAAICLHSPREGIDLESADYLDQQLFSEVERVSGWKISPRVAQTKLCPIQDLPVEFPTNNMWELFDTPANVIGYFCERAEKLRAINRPLSPWFSTLQAHCGAKQPAKYYTMDMVVRACVALQTQDEILASEETQRALETSGGHAFYFDRYDLSMTATLIEFGLPNLIKKTTTPEKIKREWQQWRSQNCQSQTPLSVEALTTGIRLLSTAGESYKALRSEIIKATISIGQKDRRISSPAMLERLKAQRLAEASAQHAYVDDFWPRMVQQHLRGEVKNPEFILYIQQFRASEEFKRSHSIEESLAF